MKLLHKIIFWSHLLAGVTAGTVIFIMSSTGVVLMYEPQLSELTEWSARWVTPAPEGKRLSFDELMARVRQAKPDARPAVIVVKSNPAASVAVNLGRENTLFVNPYNGRSWAGRRRRATFSMTSSIGTAGLAPRAKAAPPLAPSPAHAISPSSGSRSPASISGGRAAGNGVD
jgi:uncharacterized iron-regulated membrane protein